MSTGQRLNGDGNLDRLEARRAGWTADRFAAMDANKDGKVSGDEFVRGRKLEREFNEKDTNGDGKLSRPEFFGFKHFMGALPSVARSCFNCFPQPIKDLFGAADANHDGALSREEYVASRNKPATPRPPIDFRPMLMKAE